MILHLRRRRAEHDDFMAEEVTFRGEIRVHSIAGNGPHELALAIQLIGTSGKRRVGHVLHLTGQDVDDLLVQCKDNAMRRRRSTPATAAKADR